MPAATGEGVRSDLAIAAAISVVLHLLVGVAVFGRMEVSALSREKQREAESQTEPSPPENPGEPKRPRLRLGIEQSSHASVTWLGFDTPEEHQVPQESKVEQAALAREDVSGMRAGAPDGSGQEPVLVAIPVEAPSESNPEAAIAEVASAPQSPPVEPRPERAREAETADVSKGEPRPDPPALPTSLPSPAVVTVPATGPETDGPARDDELTLTEKIGPKPPETVENAKEPVESPAKPDPTPVPTSGGEAAGAPPVPTTVDQTTVAPRSPTEPADAEVRPVEPTPGEEPGASVGSASRPGEGDAIRIGIRSDKESPASALKRAIKYRPGRPVAVQGLELATVEPRWPVSVRLTSNPKNPVLVIHFDRKGVVTRADFLKDEKKGIVYSTGEPAVDEPLRTAIFQWRAKGEELLRVPADNPDATVSIVMEIVLNGR